MLYIEHCANSGAVTIFIRGGKCSLLVFILSFYNARTVFNFILNKLDKILGSMSYFVKWVSGCVAKHSTIIVKSNQRLLVLYRFSWIYL